jgi:CRP-like cAMP-binding protein
MLRETPVGRRNGNTENRLLSRLPETEYRHFLSNLELVTLNVKQRIYRANEPIRSVYFPLTAVVSQLATMKDGTSAEVATTGNEGLVGVSMLLGAEHAKFSTFALIGGDAFRMDAGKFRNEIRPGERLDSIVRSYLHVVLFETAQGRACNQLHTVHQRCACWLMKLQDGVGSPDFEITQEFLCQMLGVRRATISEIASALQKDGLIRYTRGKITILNRAGLESAGCECYQAIRSEYETSVAGNRSPK